MSQRNQTTPRNKGARRRNRQRRAGKQITYVAIRAAGSGDNEPYTIILLERIRKDGIPCFDVKALKL